MIPPDFSRPSCRGSSRAKDFAGDVAAVALIEMSGLTWAVTKSSISVSYTASEAVKCSIWGRRHGFPLFDPWYVNAVEHTVHSHTKTGLSASTQYDIWIGLSTDEGAVAYFYSESGYYIVETANASDVGGGYIGTVY